MLRHASEGQLVRKKNESDDDAHTDGAQQGNLKPAPGPRRSGRIGAGLRKWSHQHPLKIRPGLRAAPTRRRRPASTQPAHVSLEKATLFAGGKEPGLRAASAAPIKTD